LARYDDDPTASSGPHGWQKRFGEGDRPEQIGRKELLPDSARHFLDAPYGGDPSVVHKDVGCTYRLLNRLGGSEDRRWVIEVESDT
jgi:hypothetical protein